MIWGNSHEWEKKYMVGIGWSKKGECKHPHTGLPIALLYNKDSYHQWAVEYAGSGHYFHTLQEAEAWAEERMRRP